MRFVFQTCEQPASFSVQADEQWVWMVHEGQAADHPLLPTLPAPASDALRRAIEDEGFSGKSWQTQSVVLPPNDNLPQGRVTLLGLGPADRTTFNPAFVRVLAGRALRSASSKTKRMFFCLPPVAFDSLALASQAVVEGFLLASYRFDKYLAADRKRKTQLEEVVVLLPSTADVRVATASADRAEIIAQAVCIARDLTNESPSEKPPRRIVEIAQDLASRTGFSCQVFDRDACEAMGMHMFVSVGRGSVEAPCLIHLTYRPIGIPARKIALVGKTVTFDSGGLSLKSTESMLPMKNDMGGGAAVLATMSSLARLGCPFEVHGLLAVCENMPSGTCYKLGDVLRCMNGKTVELVNTDAEGRLTLGDAITYALDKVFPEEIIDIATLTGTAPLALGNGTAALFSNNDALAHRVMAAAEKSGEDMWRLPLRDRLFDSIKSDIAHMKNSGEKCGGAIIAALFLREFVSDKPWVHLDIAGPVLSDKDFGHLSKGATGYGTSTLVELLCPTP
jgi:leucyl aminopeptidase